MRQIHRFDGQDIVGKNVNRHVIDLTQPILELLAIMTVRIGKKGNHPFAVPLDDFDSQLFRQTDFFHVRPSFFFIDKNVPEVARNTKEAE